MLKFLIIVFIISYVVYKIGGFIYKALFVGGQEAQRPFDDHSRSRKPADGNVYVDGQPQKQPSKKPDKQFDGGEYVDYEEVE